MALTGSVQRPTLPAGTAWDTAYYRRWANHFAVQQIDGLTLATSRRVSYQALFDREFPAVWAAHLDHLSRNPGDDSAGMPLAERMAPLNGLPACLLFRPPADLQDSTTLSRLLAHETAADRAAIARYEGLNEEARRAHPGFVPEAIDDDQTLRALLALWRTDLNDLEAAAARTRQPITDHAAPGSSASNRSDRRQAATHTPPV
ncbi:hypothetical protein ACFYW6_36800 [Streptomyces sp. NPDC002659]|uniref:hypothetical protein n=1 Tax=Streptomyces sp. NPDC002659 TaxID=3364656 RepID=UPI0036C5CBA1